MTMKFFSSQKKADHKYFLQSTLSFFNTIKNSIHNK